jgi:hypothetical protein
MIDVPQLAEVHASAIRVVAPFSFYEDNGSFRQWSVGQVVEDPVQVALLRDRGASLVDAAVQADGQLLGEAVSDWQVADRHVLARNRHLFNFSLVHHLDSCMARVKRQSAAYEHVAENPNLAPADRANARLAGLRIFQEADALFVGWWKMTAEEARCRMITEGMLPW